MSQNESSDPPPAFRIPGVRVADNGRVEIPTRYHDEPGIEPNAVVDVHFHTGGTLEFVVTDAILGSNRYRFRIPSRKRRIYGVEDGDVYDLEVAPTGIVLEDDDQV